MNYGFDLIKRDGRYLIYSQLDRTTLIRCKRVCKMFYKDILNFPGWKEVFARENPGFVPERMPLMGWEKFYKNQTLLKLNLLNPTSDKYVTIKVPGLGYGHFLGQKLYANTSKNWDNSEYFCYDLITGKKLKKIVTIPKEAFPREMDKDLPINKVDSFKNLDGKHFLIVSNKGSQLSIWDSEDNKCIFAQQNVFDGIVCPKGSQVIYFTTEGFIEIWDYKTKTLIRQIEGIKPIEMSRLEFAIGNHVSAALVDNIFFVCMGGKFVMAFDLENGNLKYTLSFLDKEKGIRALKTTENHLIIESKEQVVIYQPQSGEIVRNISLQSSPKRLSQSELRAEVIQNILIMDQSDNAQLLRCENLESGELEHIFDFECDIRYWMISGNRVYVLTKDNTHRLIDIETKKIIFERKISYDSGCNLQINQENIRVHRDNNNIIIQGADALLFWDMEKMQSMQLDSGFNKIYFDGRILVQPRYELEGNTYNGMSYHILDLSYSPQVSIFKRVSTAVKSLFSK